MMEKELKLALDAAIRAGSAILCIYERDFEVEYKEDNSPLTEADKAAHHIICDTLEDTGLPVLSEESRAVPYEQRKSWNRYWLVDPLDGTKEFIKKNGEFTVNIALIDGGKPVMGIVYAPVLRTVYCGMLDVECGMSRAWKVNGCHEKSIDEIVGSASFLSTSHFPRPTQRALRVVASRSHCNEETQAFIQALEEEYGAVDRVSSGSSLKLCLVADGTADMYPRIAPTMEWDTAAAHAVVSAAGGRVVKYDPAVPAGGYLSQDSELEDLEYNKTDLLNPFFVVC